jgi:hypothetical protein
VLGSKGKVITNRERWCGGAQRPVDPAISLSNCPNLPQQSLFRDLTAVDYHIILS